MFNTAVESTKDGLYQPNPALERRVEERTAELSLALALVEAQKRELENALRMQALTQRQLAAELEDAQLLHGISAMLIDEHTIDDLYQRLVEAATLVMRSDFGTLQRHDADTGELELIANRGLDADAVAYWQSVYAGRATTCGKALQLGQRVIVPDFEDCDFIAGSDDLRAFRAAGVRAAQSTPLLTRSGRLVGMITTHWGRCHEPQERELRLLDIVARQAADLIERSAAAAALQRQATQLLEADRHKNEFLATLAHELRNPLAPIQAGLTLLASGDAAVAPRLLPMMERQLGHMVRLIDDLLDVSRISHGKVMLKPARVDLRSIIDSAVETSGPLIAAAGHQFTVALPAETVWLQADATRVAQIVSNLLNNAAKYTPHGGRVDLVAELAGAEVTIRVADSGIGIPAAMLPEIFGLFTQVDGTQRAQGGLGVGLALARQLAELHDGRIDVQSPWQDGGSAFTLYLPVTSAAAPVPAPAVNAAAPRRPARVLIVDDSVDAAETLAQLLDALGHTTSVVSQSPAAVAAALEFAPDVMFLDLGMPHINGYQLAQQIRQQAVLSHVYLAALSGWGTAEDRARSRDAGFDYHLTKPAMLDELENIIAQAGRGTARMA